MKPTDWRTTPPFLVAVDFVGAELGNFFDVEMCLTLVSDLQDKEKTTSPSNIVFLTM